MKHAWPNMLIGCMTGFHVADSALLAACCSYCSSDAKLAATLPELRGSVASPHAGQVRKQRALGGQVFEHIQRLCSQMNQHRHAGLPADETSRRPGAVGDCC
jgi:hypothetical protein